MKKGILALLLVVSAAVGMTACGGKSVETQEVDYDMTFENQTGIDVSKVEIRYAEDADWTPISLTEETWQSGYEMPVSMKGQMPVAENGWQVQMTFGESEIQRVWEGVHFADEVTFTFTMENGEMQVITSTEAEEAPVEETEAPTEEITTEE